MANSDAPPLPREVIDALLEMDDVQAILARVWREYNGDIPFKDLSRDSLAILVSALVMEGVIQIGPGRALSTAEFEDLLDAEDAAGLEDDTEPRPSQ